MRKKAITIDYLHKNVLKFLGMTDEEYSIYLFDLGIKYLEKRYPESMDLSKTRLYWGLFKDSVMMFIDFKYEAQIKEDMALAKNENNLEFFENMAFDYISTGISLIDTVNRCLKDTTTQTPTRTPKKKNNQLEINLNTI